MIGTQGTNFLDNNFVLGTNRTGAALVVGGVYALDITASDATSTNPDAAMGNVVAVAAGNIRGFLVLAVSAVAAGAVGNLLLRGFGNVLCDGSGTAIAKGDKLKPTAASNQLTKLAAGQLVMPCAVAQATCAAANTLTYCLFDGENWKCELAAS